MYKLILALYSLTIVSCSRDKTETDLKADTYICETQAVQNNFTKKQLFKAFDETIIQGIASIDVFNMYRLADNNSK